MGESFTLISEQKHDVASLGLRLAQLEAAGRCDVKRLIDLPMAWSDQWSTLGLKARAQNLVG
jgi:hypothetical protein